MLDFENYVARYGEFGVQAIIERLERYEGIRGQVGHSLEARWAVLMGSPIHSPAYPPQQAMAA